VAFVDEAIHHKTPTVGPRTASAQGLRTALAYVYEEEYKDTENAYRKYNATKSFRQTAASPGAGLPLRWSSYLTNAAAKANAKDWLVLHEKIATLQASSKVLGRVELKSWLPQSPHFTDHAEEILEQAATDFTSVTF